MTNKEDKDKGAGTEARATAPNAAGFAAEVAALRARLADYNAAPGVSAAIGKLTQAYQSLLGRAKLGISGPNEAAVVRHHERLGLPKSELSSSKAQPRP